MASDLFPLRHFKLTTQGALTSHARESLLPTTSRPLTLSDAIQRQRPLSLVVRTATLARVHDVLAAPLTYRALDRAILLLSTLEQDAPAKPMGTKIPEHFAVRAKKLDRILNGPFLVAS